MILWRTIEQENTPSTVFREQFFDAAAQGKLLIRKCNACGEHHHYPRSLCPYCFSDQTEWRDAKGSGTIYTYSVLRRGVPVPYCIAYVTLDEGVSMLTNIVDCDLDAVKIGMKVRVLFKPTDGGPPVPMFTPAQENRGQSTISIRLAATQAPAPAASSSAYTSTGSGNPLRRCIPSERTGRPRHPANRAVFSGGTLRLWSGTPALPRD
jgi:uncharacterized OB-fold protein